MSTTRYGEKIPGAVGNYNWQVRFDITQGYVGVCQWRDDGALERVLLSPEQVAELIAFVAPKRKRKAQS